MASEWGVDVLAALSDPVDARRARHVLTENERVLDFVAACAELDFGAAGRLFTASHASMRDDFEITTEHIDLIADAAVAAGALGARMTGGGFGGCVVALVPQKRIGEVQEAIARRYPQASGGLNASVYVCHASAGASAY